MKNITLFLLLLASAAQAQKFTAEKSSVVFFSKAAIEDITAHTEKSQSIFNASTGDIVFIIPIQDFEFQKALMKEHFNEKYMETEKFSKATFQGKVAGFDLKGTGKQELKATGKLTIHGVTKEVEIPGTIEAGEKLLLQTKFMVKLADFNITIPTLLFKNIAESVEVTAEFTYKPQ